MQNCANLWIELCQLLLAQLVNIHWCHLIGCEIRQYHGVCFCTVQLVAG